MPVLKEFLTEMGIEHGPQPCSLLCNQKASLYMDVVIERRVYSVAGNLGPKTFEVLKNTLATCTFRTVQNHLSCSVVGTSTPPPNQHASVLLRPFINCLIMGLNALNKVAFLTGVWQTFVTSCHQDHKLVINISLRHGGRD